MHFIFFCHRTEVCFRKVCWYFELSKSFLLIYTSFSWKRGRNTKYQKSLCWLFWQPIYGEFPTDVVFFQKLIGQHWTFKLLVKLERKSLWNSYLVIFEDLVQLSQVGISNKLGFGQITSSSAQLSFDCLKVLLVLYVNMLVLKQAQIS